MKSYRIGIVGSGKVAYQLCNTLLNKGHKIHWLYSRTLRHAAVLGKKYGLSYTDKINNLDPNIDFILVAIKDDAIAEMMAKLSSKLKFKGIILHSSGSIPSKVSKGHFKNYGVFYPLQTFSKKTNLSFQELPVCITGNSKRTLTKIKKLASSLSNRVYEISDQQRFVLHISAVFACNFTNHMYTIAEKILEDNQLDFDMLRPLITETTKKINVRLASESQTGPAARKDGQTIESHLRFLEKYPGWKVIYEQITKDIMD
jgi:predicted short-subunit dehydrogenase-like oxidoreductase (DUF2520 family)